LPKHIRRKPRDWWKLHSDQLEPEEDEESEEGDLAYEIAMSAAYPEEPLTFSEAMRRHDAEKWRQAALEELGAHQSNGTWKTIEKPPEVKIIGSKWIFKLKRNADGSIDHYKARLVAKGYNQCPGFDYIEIFTPTVRLSSIRVILALAALQDLELCSVDVSYAYLNREMDCEVYMVQPEGFIEGDPKAHVCLLEKAIYGSKQGGNRWNKKMRNVLESLGFRQCYSNASIYIFSKDDISVILPVFVDDITFVSCSRDTIESLVHQLSQHFKIRDLGHTTQLLGIKIDRDRSKNSISLSQHQYCVNILDRFGMADCKPLSTPMEPNLHLSRSQCPQTTQEVDQMRHTPYLAAVGALMYLATTTRPDIAYTVGSLARFNSNPGWVHWLAVKHLMRYIKGTMDYSLIYAPDPTCSEPFLTYSDADHGGCKDTGRSTGGYILKMGTGAVSWSSKLQGVVSLSTTEAEYIAAVQGGKEIKWLRNLLLEIGLPCPGPFTLLLDNQSAISVAKNPEHHGRMKQLDLSFYWLRDAVQNWIITPDFVPTDEQAADLLTKALPKAKVIHFCKMLGLGGSGGSH